MGRCWGFFAFWVASSYTIGRIAHFRHSLVFRFLGGVLSTTTTADVLDIPFFHFLIFAPPRSRPWPYLCCLHKRLLFEISRIPLGDGCCVAHVLLKVRIIIIFVWILFWLSPLALFVLPSQILHYYTIPPPLYRLEGRAGLGDTILVLADPAITCCRRVVGVFYSFLLSFAKTPHYTSHTVPVIIRFLVFLLGGGEGRRRRRSRLVFFYLSTIFYYRHSHHHYRVLYLLSYIHQLRYIIIHLPSPSWREARHQRAIVIAAPTNQTIFLSLHVLFGLSGAAI